MDRLASTASTPIVSVVAPPGYGKTTVLAQWTTQQPRATAWVNVDSLDNDPNVLLTHVAVALDRVEPLGDGVFSAVASPAAALANVTAARVTAAMGSMTRPFVLVLDHLEALHNPAACDAVALLADCLPAGGQLALGSRHEPPLPMSLVRSHGDVVEVTADDLAMDETEAEALLAGVGVRLDPDELAALIDRTEGWAAGLYLAALAVKAGRSQRSAGFAFSGDDRLMADYLRSQFLSLLSPEEVRFLVRTSVLERLTGGLCDEVLDDVGSASVLRNLEASNLLVVPLDRHREWYRYHRLLRDMLARQLELDEPEIVADLHQRAADWHERHHLPEAAIHHAMAAGDEDRSARLVQALTIPAYASGRVETTTRWFGWFESRDVVAHHPAIAVLGALLRSLAGEPAAAERWAAAAEPTGDAWPPESYSRPEPPPGWRPLLRALLCRHGVAEMRADAEAAVRAMPAGAFLRWTAILLEGIAHLLEGDVHEADRIVADAYEVAMDTGANPAVAAALAIRSLIAMDRRRWPDAEAMLDRAVELVRTAGIEEYIESALVFALAARVATRAGDHARATEHLTQVNRIRPRLNHAIPYQAALTLIHAGYAYLEMGDAGGARAVTRELRDVLLHRPDLGVIVDQATEMYAVLEAAGDGTVGVSSLTAAELRLVPFLSTHLSFREIGERLYLSRHTVKTQAISIYRKLGVSSRSGAIERMHAIGLIERT
jgi:LuxR family maltose regulon positive regulatory protein